MTMMPIIIEDSEIMMTLTLQQTSSQAPSYARRLQSETITHLLTYSLAHRGKV